ncbi:MAG: helix-turn-helix domain-containing protein [Anaerolineaceae bacterium]|nr:helix-turn-helix domain-containing protein [Anaerolineaceae bacterium]
MLSIKMFRYGRAFYQSGSGTFAVEDDRYLILNDQQPYSITVESAAPVESFCVFFPAGFAEAVHHSLTTSDGHLLDNPIQTRQPLNFVDRTYPHDELLTPAVRRLQDAQANVTAGWVDEQMHVIMRQMLNVHLAVNEQIARLPAVRAATREELYRRLFRAHDYILACYDSPIQLTDMAQAANLSTTHFLRAFKQLFRQTPHQFLTAYRLQQAAKMLNTQRSVTDICLAVGFESLGSFSTLFRRYYGVSPENFRRQKGDFQEAQRKHLC